MLDGELTDIVAALRARSADDADVEAKRARDRLPKSVRASLSAFANTRGGTLVLGLDEESGFTATGVLNPAKISSDLAALCSDDMEPPLRPLIKTHTLDGIDLVVAEIPALDPRRRPCYYRGAGITQGSFVRVGDGDRRLSSYEVHLMLANRGQPTDDEDLVPDTSPDELDHALTESFIARLRRRRPRAFADLGSADALRRARVLSDDHITLAGLMALGDYPQEYCPQLMVTFVHYPTPDGPAIGAGPRFVDSFAAEGSIPTMVDETLIGLRRNMSRRAVVRGAGRTDTWDYPEAALREAIVNALVHRDYSPESRGTQVQVEMYPDRLTIRNPGGLFGNVVAERLGDEGLTATRNATLLKILEDTPIPGTNESVCENRGSGISTIRIALRDAGLPPPQFTDSISSFRVTFMHPATEPEVPPNSATHRQRRDKRGQILNAIGNHERTRAELVALTGLNDRTVTRWLNALRVEGALEQVGGAVRSPNTRYRRSHPTD